MALDDPSIFTDYTTGNNWCTEQTCCQTNNKGGSDFGYQAEKGWDPVYGLGTPNVGKMIEWLSKNNARVCALGIPLRKGCSYFSSQLSNSRNLSWYCRYFS